MNNSGITRTDLDRLAHELADAVTAQDHPGFTEKTTPTAAFAVRV